MVKHKIGNIKRWEKEIQSWKDSGLCQSEYCHQTGISVSTLQGWSRKLKNYDQVQEKPEITPGDFTEVKFNKSAMNNELCNQTGISLSIGKDINIILNKCFDKFEFQKTVTAVLEVL